MKTYKLFHYASFNNELTDVVFVSKLSVRNLEHAVAHIQFKTDELQHAGDLNTIEIVMILKMFYDNTIQIADNNATIDKHIDEFEIWEAYCGKADDIITDSSLIRNGLDMFIKKLLDTQSAILENQL